MVGSLDMRKEIMFHKALHIKLNIKQQEHMRRIQVF